MQNRLGFPGERLVDGRVCLTRYRIGHPALPKGFDGFKMAVLSDLHEEWYGKEQEGLLRLIEKADPDWILVPGDVVCSCSGGDAEPFLTLLRQVCPRWPVAFSMGNHEEKLDPSVLEPMLEEMQALGVTVLHNETMTLRRGGDSLHLGGLRLPLSCYKRLLLPWEKPTPLDQAGIQRLMGRAPEGFTVLMAHNPLYFESYARWGADVVLSGHVHGGIIEIPGFAGLLSPERRFFPRYSAGEYRIGQSRLVVGRGLCTGAPLLRIHNPREVLLVELFREESPTP